MEKTVTKDMTQGKPMKHIAGFALPLLFGFLFQQFYNLADTVIVGRYLGVGALAAVGSTGAINFLIIGFCMGVCNGFGIPVAQSFGARDFGRLRKFVANSAILSIIFSLVMTVVIVVFCRQILVLMRTPENIIQSAYEYIVVIFIGIPATFLYNILSSYIRSVGDSKTPVIFLTLSSLLNIGLDLLFILVFDMGVAGAAWATVLSQLVSGIACLIYMIKHFSILRVSKDEWRPDQRCMTILCSMGIPMGLQYSITAIGSVILQTAVNTLGEAAVAAVTAGSKIGMFFCCPFDALGSTMATYGGQNVGAKKLKRIGEGLKSAVIIGAVYSVIAFIVMLAAGKELGYLFMDKGNEEILSNVQRFLVINAAFYFPLALVNIIRFLIQGLGFSKFAILAGVCEMVARTAVGFLLIPMLGYTAVCFANPLAWIAADLFLIPAYISVMRKLREMFHQ